MINLNKHRIYFGTRSLSWNGIQFLSHLTKQEKTADI